MWGRRGTAVRPRGGSGGARESRCPARHTKTGIVLKIQNDVNIATQANKTIMMWTIPPKKTALTFPQRVVWYFGRAWVYIYNITTYGQGYKRKYFNNVFFPDLRK